MIGYLRFLFAGVFAFGMGGGGGGGITPYSPTGLGGADTAWQTLLSQEMNTIPGTQAATQSQLPSLYQQLIGNLGIAAPGIENVAQQAGAYETNMAGQADQFHNIMSGIGTNDYANAASLMGNANTVMNTAMDPQQALYKQGLQQTQDASNAATSMRGIGMSPEAAGIENQATGNYNINWDNQQLARQLSGLSGLGTATTQAGQAGAAGSAQLTGAQEMSALAPQLLMSGAQLPEQTTAGLLNSGLTNAMNFSNAEMTTQEAPLAGIMSQIIPYLNFGVGAQNNAFQAGNALLGDLGQGAGFAANQASLPGGGIFGSLGSLFGGSAAIPAGGTAATAAGEGSLLGAGFSGAGDLAATGAAADAGAGAAAGVGGDAALAAMAWVVCTELHRQGRMPSRVYYSAAPTFLKYSERGKRGYYVWAIPSTRHLRAHPDSRYSKLLDRVFNCRAAYISDRKRGRPTTLSGAIITHGLYAFCWTLSWFVPARFAGWSSLYEQRIA